MQLPFKKDLPPDFSKPDVRQSFVQGAHTAKELLQKELDINRAEQVLLKERVRLMNGFINDLPASDPQYGMLAAQAKRDQIELDELVRREETICSQLRG